MEGEVGGGIGSFLPGGINSLRLRFVWETRGRREL